MPRGHLKSLGQMPRALGMMAVIFWHMDVGWFGDEDESQLRLPTGL
jgi:alpha-glucosidase (family GH31 glycosyl hydrolase)